MLRWADGRAGGTSVTFTTAQRRKYDETIQGSSGCKGDVMTRKTSELTKSTTSTKENASEAPFDPSPSSPPSSSSSSSSSLSSSIGVYLGFYWWILVITAGLGPTLWSSMYLCWTLGASGRGWLCLAVSAVYWIAMARVVPCDPEDPPLWARGLASHVLERTVAFFSGGFDVVLDDERAFGGGEEGEGKSEGPYVVGFEPHSTLPMAAVLAFARGSPLSRRLPGSLRGARLLASSACFSAPIVRHAWSWLGFAPASRETMARLLTTGRVNEAKAPPRKGGPTDDGRGGRGCRGVSVVLCPGGIREVLHLDKDRETIYLRSRRGFVRQALAAGAPLVPAFAFGQTRAFDWFPLLPSPFPFSRSFVARLCRSVGFAPLWIHNGWLVPFPKRSTGMTLVIGKPIEFSRRQSPSSSSSSSSLSSSLSSPPSSSSLSSSDSDGDLKRGAPSSPPPPLAGAPFDERDVERYLAEFVEAMRDLYERHAPALGYGDVPLTIL